MSRIPTEPYFKPSGEWAIRNHAGNDILKADGDAGHTQVTDMVRHVRARFTAAQVNSGAEILAAISGYKYRIVDMAMIAIGGNAAGATTVDILGTASSSSRKLMASAVAGLTQNTLLRAGESNGAILAGGASFTENDANTAINIGNTGSNLTGASHIDVLISYVLEE